MSLKKYAGFMIMMTLAIVCAGSELRADNIGYIDMQKLNQGYPAAKQVEQEFQKKYQEYQKDVDTRQKKIEDEKKANKKPEEIDKMVKAMEDELKPKQDELIALRTQLGTKLQTDILGAVKVVAKEYGIDVVLLKEAVLYGGFDLTEFAIEKLTKK